MKVLMVTGDRTFKPGHPRYDLVARAADIEVVYWGAGSLWPHPRNSFEVVTSQDPFWRGLFAWQLARRHGARLNVQVHADLDAQPWLKHVLAQIVLRHADSVRVASATLATQVQRIAPRARITVLPVYVDLARFRNSARRPHAGKTILWVGRFEKEKDPGYALTVLTEVRTRTDTRLVMLGTGSLEIQLKRDAAGLPVEFVGWQDPAPYLAEADVVLCTSPAESYGVSIVEALAAGVPVVAPDVGIAREAGASIAPREDLAKKVIEVLATSPHAELKFKLLTADEWVREWLKSL